MSVSHYLYIWFIESLEEDGIRMALEWMDLISRVWARKGDLIIGYEALNL